MKDLPTQQDLPAGKPGNEDELKAENEVLKLKLELEFGMERSDTSSLDPQIENQWLNNIYNFEKRYKDAKRIKLYDLLGRPSFRRIEELKGDEIGVALAEIQLLMEEKGVELDCCVTYEPSVIYKFIIEELFDYEMDDIMLPGFVHHFIYEEFHPNHDYDLRRRAKELVQILLRRKLVEFDVHTFADRVQFGGAELDRDEIMKIISAFQEAHNSFRVKKFKIERVAFDLNAQTGQVSGNIQYAQRGNGNPNYSGPFVLKFVREYEWWTASGFQLPGFGDLQA